MVTLVFHSCMIKGVDVVRKEPGKRGGGRWVVIASHDHPGDSDQDIFTSLDKLISALHTHRIKMY